MDNPEVKFSLYADLLTCILHKAVLFGDPYIFDNIICCSKYTGVSSGMLYAVSVFTSVGC